MSFVIFYMNIPKSLNKDGTWLFGDDVARSIDHHPPQSNNPSTTTTHYQQQKAHNAPLLLQVPKKQLNNLYKLSPPLSVKLNRTCESCKTSSLETMNKERSSEMHCTPKSTKVPK